MKRNKHIIFIIALLIFITFLMLTGCAAYRDLRSGTVREIPGQGANISEIKYNSSIIDKEAVIVRQMEEPPPTSDYIVGPGDGLFINVSGKPEFSSLGTASSSTNIGTSLTPTVRRVDSNGNIQIPYLGLIHVGGKTLTQVQNSILEVAKKYINDPWVIVDVGDYRSHPLYLLGMFKNCGIFYMDRPMNILQAIALGNGFDTKADLSSARIIRDKKTVPVDINELLTKADQKQNVWLKSGDTIYIPDNTNRLVFVFGAIKKGGPITIPSGGLTLSQAIATAELRDTGHDFRYVRIIRSLSTTRGELMVVDFDKILRGEAMPLILQQGDIVYVPKSGLGNWNDAINELLPSLQAFSAILQPFVQIKYLSQ